MARKQKLINFHGSKRGGLEGAKGDLALGEIAVVTEDINLAIKGSDGYLHYFVESGVVHTAIATAAETAVANKADKVTGAVAGNFAGLDANGNLTDSGKKAADFDTAGAAATVKTEVVGSATDEASADTIYGAKKYAEVAASTAESNLKGSATDTKDSKTIEGAKKYADSLVADGSAIDQRLDKLETCAHTHTNKSVLDSITQARVDAWNAAEVNVITAVTVDGTALAVTDKTVNIDLSGKVSKEEGKSLMTQAEHDKLAGIEAGAQVNDTYELTATTTSEGMLKTYVLQKKIGGTGETVDCGKIDINKDQVVTGGEVVVNPAGYAQGTYLKLTIANGSDVFVPVQELAHDYTAGSGIDVSSTRVVSVKTATGDSAGNVDLSFVDGALKANTDLSAYVPTATTIAGIDLADNITAAELTAALDDVVASGTTSAGSKGLMTPEQATKLAGIDESADVNVLESVTLGTVTTSASEQSGAKTSAVADKTITLDLSDLDIDCGSWDA